MPLYEYKCADCFTSFEQFHPMKDAHKHQPCPHCKRPAPRYYGTPPNFYFTGEIGQNIIERSPMKDANKGLPDDI